MNAKQLSRELRRVARQEVPNGETNLWPEIRNRVAARRTPYSSPSSHGSYIRSETSDGRPELSSVYVWSAEARPGRIGNGARLLAAGAVVALLVALLAVVMGNHGGDNRPAGMVASPASAPAGSGTPAASPASLAPGWSSSGKLTIPISPAGGSDLTGTVDAQILPTGDLRLRYRAATPSDAMTWHVVPENCPALTAVHELDLDGRDIIPAFLVFGGQSEFVPADKTHQPMTLLAFAQRGGSPVACAAIPAVPDSLIVVYDPAPGVPRTCPVTLPTTPRFAPRGAPVDPGVGDGDFWYGTDDLYTGLPLDGVWATTRQKVFWWSTAYSVNAEPEPALQVTGKRLDGDAPPATVDPPTNGAGGMLAGVTFSTPGCWQVTGAYKGHSLSFVVWVNDDSGTPVTQAPGPVPVATPAPGADGLIHTDLVCDASSFGPSTASPSDINVEFAGTASSGQFWALLFQEMPLYANQNTELAWKIGSPDPLTLTVEDAQGNRIDPSSGPSPSATSNWPRPGSEWLSSIVFPHSGCWHVQARAGTATGDMWFEVFSPPGTPAAITPEPVRIGSGPPLE